MKRIVLCLVVLCSLAVVGCTATQSTPEMALERILTAAERANIKGTVDGIIYGGGEAWMKNSFGIGNPHSRLEVHLTFGFEKPEGAIEK